MDQPERASVRFVQEKSDASAFRAHVLANVATLDIVPMQEFLKSLNVLTAGVRLSGDFGRRTARWTGVLALMLSLTNTSRGQPVESPADALRAATLLEKAFEQVIEKSSRAIVSLQIEEVRGDGKSPPAGRSPQTQTDLFGSGVLLRGEGDQRFILTNAHLVQSVLIPATGSRMTATWGEHRRVPVAVHAADPRSDLAILRIDLGGRLKPAAIPALTIGRAEGLRRGRLVVTLGNPYAIAWWNHVGPAEYVTLLTIVGVLGYLMMLKGPKRIA